jgi:hypothetical protein
MATARSTKAAASAAVMSEVAARRTSAASVVIAPEASAAATTATSSATGRLCRSWAVELEFGCHRLAAVLRKFERQALPFCERLNARFGECGYVDENVGAAAIR